MKFKYLFPLALFCTAILASCGEEEPEPEPEPVMGCTDENSLNYNADATQDDGSCLEIDETNRNMFVEFSGTWCWACGDYGAKVNKDIKSQWGDNVVLFIAHKGSDPMTNPISNAWVQYWKHSSTPSFVANGQLTPNGTHPVAPANEKFNQKFVLDAQVGLQNAFTRDGNMLKGTAYTQNLLGLENKNYQLAVYVIGHNFVHSQIADDGSTYPEWEFDASTKTYPEYIHSNILYAEVNNKPFGIPVEGDFEEGDVFSIDYEFEVGDDWAPDFEIALIVWDKTDASNYEFINAGMFAETED